MLLDNEAKTSWPALIVLCVITLAIGGGIYYWQSQQKVEKPVTVTPIPKATPTVSPTEAEIVEGETYTNEKYGFTLQFPDTWEGYVTKETKWIDNKTVSIEFGLPEQELIFDITIFTPEEWEKISSEEGPKPTKISENDEYVFAYGHAQDAVNDEIVQRMEEIDDIIATFKLTE